MTTIRETARKFEDEIVNAGVPPQNNQAPPQEQAPQGDQALVNPPAMSDGEIRLNFINLDKSMSTQDQDIATQVQAMAA